MSPVRTRPASGLGSIVAFVLAVLAGAAVTAAPAAAPRGQAAPDLAALLPAAGEAPGWVPSGDAQLYKGDDLFTYIDGGAEIYQEYGFRAVVVRDYKDAAGRGLTVELFEMADAAAAFGMFTFKSGPSGRALPLGQGAEIEDYYLSFWKGPYLATITGSDASPGIREGLRRLAGALDGKIRARGDLPSVVSLLPGEWAARGGIKYVRGPLGFFNLHPAFSKPVARFRDGVAASPAEGAVAVVLDFDSGDKAGAALIEARRAYAPDAAAPADPRQGGFEARDAKGRIVQIKRFETRIIVLASLNPLPDSDKIWRRIGESLARRGNSAET